MCSNGERELSYDEQELGRIVVELDELAHAAADVPIERLAAARAAIATLWAIESKLTRERAASIIADAVRARRLAPSATQRLTDAPGEPARPMPCGGSETTVSR